jgi:hypothetical protein
MTTQADLDQLRALDDVERIAAARALLESIEAGSVPTPSPEVIAQLRAIASGDDDSVSINGYSWDWIWGWLSPKGERITGDACYIDEEEREGR